jgi:hypothetical protein
MASRGPHRGMPDASVGRTGSSGNAGNGRGFTRASPTCAQGCCRPSAVTLDYPGYGIAGGPDSRTPSFG